MEANNIGQAGTDTFGSLLSHTAIVLSQVTSGNQRSEPLNLISELDRPSSAPVFNIITRQDQPGIAKMMYVGSLAQCESNYRSILKVLESPFVSSYPPGQWWARSGSQRRSQPVPGLSKPLSSTTLGVPDRHPIQKAESHAPASRPTGPQYPPLGTSSERIAAKKAVKHEQAVRHPRHRTGLKRIFTVLRCSSTIGDMLKDSLTAESP